MDSKPTLPDGIEVRSFADFEMRAAGDGEPTVIEGHAATFNDPYPIADFEEQISPGAFRDSLDDPNIAALFNHEPSLLLGTVGTGKVKLSEDKVGLRSVIEMPDTTLGRDLTTLIASGEVRTMSFGFMVTEETWTDRGDEPDLRTISGAKLFDVSPVTFPANPNTDVAVASRAEWRKANAQNVERPGSDGMSQDLRITEEQADKLMAAIFDAENEPVTDEPVADEPITDPNARYRHIAEIVALSV